MTLYIRPGADVSRVKSLIDSGAFSVKNIPGIGTNGARILKNGESAVAGSILGAGTEGISEAIGGTGK